MAAIDTLLGMQSDTNLSGDDGYMKKRRANILGGYEDAVPDADSANTRYVQHQLGRMGLGVSRDSIQEDRLAELRQAIGMERMKHSQIMQREQMRGQFELAAADRQGDAATQRMLLTDMLLRGRESARADRIDNRQDDQQEAVAERAVTKQQTGGVPTGDMINRLSKSRQAYQGGGMNTIRSMFGMQRSGRQDYEASLTDVLARQGTLANLQGNIKSAQAEGMSGSQLIAEAEAAGRQLSPYEVEYIKLTLGE